MTMILSASTEAQFDQLVAKQGITVVDFWATWCGPCKAIAPVYEQLSSKYPSITFLKVDTDGNSAVARRFAITAMPTFVFLRDGKEVERLRGANPSKLSSLTSMYAGGGGAQFPEGGHTLGGASIAETTPTLRGGVNPLLVVALIFFVGPWLYQKLSSW